MNGTLCGALEKVSRQHRAIPYQAWQVTLLPDRDGSSRPIRKQLFFGLPEFEV